MTLISEVQDQKKMSHYLEANLVRVLDGNGKHHQHCHFTDVHGKEGVFEGYDFSYSIFNRGYFHKAKFSRCKFIGCLFIDCNFRNATFRDCDFSYANFSGTRLETDQIIENLPAWPNVRRGYYNFLGRTQYL